MKRAEKNKLIAQFKSSSLNEQDHAKLEAAITNGEIALEELEIDTFVYDHLIQADEIQRTSRMDARFYAWLETEKKQATDPSISNISVSRLLKIAAVFGLLVTAFAAGIYYGNRSNEVISMHADDLANNLLTTDDISDKIHMISTTNLSKNADTKIIKALLFTLSNDESSNVRLACIQTLIDYGNIPQVREGLINSIRFQTSPAVLINLAEAIQVSGENLSRDDYKEMINKDLPTPILKTLKDNIDKI